jgi:hypothetical protein
VARMFCKQSEERKGIAWLRRRCARVVIVDFSSGGCFLKNVRQNKAEWKAFDSHTHCLRNWSDR